MKYLMQFQQQNGLKPDGILGPNTLRVMKNIFGLSNERLAHFLGQAALETGQFSKGEENLNYSAEGLLKTFPTYFTLAQAMEYARKPERIASRVYANRMGNGPEESGDGWKHRGFGAGQLTGKANHELFANKVRDLAILNNPGIIASKYYFQSFLFYFTQNRFWGLCDEVNNECILKVSKAVNLGNPYSKKKVNHLEERIYYTRYYFDLLKKHNL
jgi:putative chitinase